MSKSTSGMANPNYTNALQEYDSFSSLKGTSSQQQPPETVFQVNSGEEEFKPSNKYKANVINKADDEDGGHALADEVEEEVDGEPEWEMLDGEERAFGLVIIKVRGKLYDLIVKPQIKTAFGVLLLLAFPIYFGFAMKKYPPFSFPNGTNSSMIISDYVFSNNRGFALFMLTIIVAIFAIWEVLIKKYLLNSKSKNKGDLVERCLPPRVASMVKKYQVWIVISIVAIACLSYLIYDLKDYYNLVSLLGLFTFIMICVLISEYPSRINLRALVVGILIQYILGVFILRSEIGFQLFKFLGNQVSTFLDYTDNGCALVFGAHFKDHFFAFKAMPVVIFFSAIVNILYYFGAIQFVLLKIAWSVNFLMGTSPTESVNSVANVFLGPSEAPLLIKPFLPKMTESELFAVMVAAFSTVSGSVLAAYIGFGVPPDHLLTAGLMSAPASLAIAKTLFPETRKTNATFDAIRTVKTKKYNNVFEAISVGAIDMLKPVGCIIANLIAFVSIFAFLDQICVWTFSMMGLDNFGIANILQYLFWPFALLMGVDPEDCRSAAMLVGTKVFVNEFVAYTKLGTVITFRDGIIANGTFELYRNGTLPIPNGYPMLWNDRSIVIITYALCGFANFGTIGIEIATLSVFAPTRSKVFLRNAAKAMLAGNFSSFMNACIAGLLFKKI